MLIFIKTLTGKTVSVDIESTAIKEKIKDRESVPVSQQRLLFAGKDLDDAKTVDECGIKKEAIIHLVLKKSEENMQHLSNFERSELKEAQSSKMSKYYNASAGLHNEVQKFQDSESKWDKHQNPSGATFDLGKDGEFKEFTVLIGQHYNEAQFTMKEAKAALNKKGFNVIHTRSEQEFLENLSKADVAWIISGSSVALPPSYVERILTYHRSLGGLFIFADNAPYVAHANRLLEQMFKNTQCTGSDPGYKTLKIGDPSIPGCFGTHLITSGIITLFEGVTISYTPDKATPLKTLAMNSSGHPAIQFADHEILADENCGRVVLDHGFTKLYMNWDDAGTARYVVNATVWLLALEHRTRIGVPITARKETQEPTRKQTFFTVEEAEFSAPSIEELTDKLPWKTLKVNPAKVLFRIGGEQSKRMKGTPRQKIEWSKSKGTEQRRPLTELEEWVIEKRSGHFYLHY